MALDLCTVCTHKRTRLTNTENPVMMEKILDNFNNVSKESLYLRTGN